MIERLVITAIAALIISVILITPWSQFKMYLKLPNKTLIEGMSHMYIPFLTVFLIIPYQMTSYFSSTLSILVSLVVMFGYSIWALRDIKSSVNRVDKVADLNVYEAIFRFDLRNRKGRLGYFLMFYTFAFIGVLIVNILFLL
jgi:hypothetical protein